VHPYIPVQFAAAGWRTYPRVPDVEAVAEDTRRLQRKTIEKNAKRWLELQRERQRDTGFPGEAPIGHRVVYELRRRGWPLHVARYGAHLAAVGGAWNWQGNTRLGQWMGRSARTCRRYRVELERKGLISSHLLLTGDKLPGQKAAVRRPMVVRNVEVLQRLGGFRVTRQEFPRQSSGQTGKPKTAAAGRPPPAAARGTTAAEQPTAEDFEQLAERSPEWLAESLELMAAARRSGAANTRAVAQQPTTLTPPPKSTPPPLRQTPLTAEELDALLRDEPVRFERGPPE